MTKSTQSFNAAVSNSFGRHSLSIQGHRPRRSVDLRLRDPDLSVAQVFERQGHIRAADASAVGGGYQELQRRSYERGDSLEPNRSAAWSSYRPVGDEDRQNTGKQVMIGSWLTRIFSPVDTGPQSTTLRDALEEHKRATTTVVYLAGQVARSAATRDTRQDVSDMTELFE